MHPVIRNHFGSSPECLQQHTNTPAHLHTLTKETLQVLLSLMCTRSPSMSVPGLLRWSSRTSFAPPASPSVLSCCQGGRIQRQCYPNSLPREVMCFWRYGPSIALSLLKQQLYPRLHCGPKPWDNDIAQAASACCFSLGCNCILCELLWQQQF